MVVTINNINDNNIVEFSTQYGSAIGRWRSKNKPYNKKYNVEFDYNGIIDENNIVFCDNKYEINICNNKIVICGKILEIDNDTMLLYVGDSILIFNIAFKHNRKFKENSYIRITLPEIDLYDENIEV